MTWFTRFCLAIAALTGLAILPMPYVYYEILRLVVFGGCALILWTARPGSPALAKVILVGAALVFNPFIKIEMSRGVWLPLNIVTAVGFVTVARRSHALRRGARS